MTTILTDPLRHELLLRGARIRVAELEAEAATLRAYLDEVMPPITTNHRRAISSPQPVRARARWTPARRRKTLAALKRYWAHRRRAKG